MPSASQVYLAELAEEFLAGQVKIGWAKLNVCDLKGETTWIDSRPDQPGVEVEMNYRRVGDSIEIEVVAYEGDDENNRVSRRAMVAR